MNNKNIWTSVALSLLISACGGGGGGNSPPPPPPADTTPPNTTISSGPGNPTNLTDASFVFTSSESGSMFECSLDSSAFSACTSPQDYSGLAEGDHTFEVRATDAAGNTDASPATQDWTIDTTPPDTTITSNPASVEASTGASFEFTSSESGSTFECSIDSGAFSSCTSPDDYSGLGEGAHTYSVQATDAAGNTDATPATFNWTIDLTAPAVTAPAAIVVETSDANGVGDSHPDIQAFLGAATANDNVDGDVSANITNDAPSQFPLGVTTVTFSVTDSVGNTGNASSAVDVRLIDDEAPDTASVDINNNAEYAVSVSELTARLIAQDNVGVTAYLITDHDTTDPMNIIPPYLDPLSSDGRWVSVTETASLDISVQFALTQAYDLGDTVDLCAWFMDAQGNISQRTCDSVIYGVSWEVGIGNWSTDNGVWQVGTPTVVGPASCFAGTQCAGTVLDGVHPSNTDSRLISTAIVLPDVVGSEELHLRFEQWFSYNTNASGQIQVSVWDSATSTWGAWINEGVAVNEASGGWSLKDIDLTAYAGETVRVAFNHVVSIFVATAGWYVDNIYIARTTPMFTGDFEAGWADWGAENGAWQVGTPSVVGPASCFEGSQCAGTVLDGVHPSDTDSRLVSATTVLPTVAGSEEVHLRFRQWFSYNTNASGQVQVSVWDAATSTWGAWINEGVAVNEVSGGWSLKDVDLTAYAGETVRIAFHHVVSIFVATAGWYVDDIEIVRTTPMFTGDFEAGWADWGADNGAWQVGTPSVVGPANCFADSMCAGTVLAGNHPSDTDSRLVSATTVLPTVVGMETVHLRFQNWFSYNTNASGQVQVSVWDAATSTWGAWVNEGTAVTNASGGWTLKDVDLTAYAGETVRVAFFHVTSIFVATPGWYIDDVVIVVL